jgi:hypothetical protein
MTPELLQIKNGYGFTPLDVEKAHLPTARQLDRLRELNIPFQELGLTTELADGLIETYKEKLKAAQKIAEPTRPRPPSKLEYIKRDTAIGTAPPFSVTLLAKSSSGVKPYKMEFTADASALRAYCHCLGGRKSICKHFIAFIKGDPSILFDPSQNEAFEHLRRMPQFQTLQANTEALLNKLHGLDEEIRNENNSFSEWYSSYREAKHPTVWTDEEREAGFKISISIGPDERLDDPEVQRRLEESNRRTSELKQKQRELKNEFMQLLRSGV